MSSGSGSEGACQCRDYDQGIYPHCPQHGRQRVTVPDVLREATVGEEWRPVIGHEGYYEVSNHGRLRSLDRISNTRWGPRPRRGRLLKTSADRQGYRVATLGNSRSRKVHQLVLAAFVGPVPDGQVVRHLNGDKADNRLENLAYGTVTENNRDTVEHGAHWQSVKTQCPKGHEYTPQNVYARLRPDGRKYRQCRTCWNDYQRERRRMRKAVVR